MARRKNTASRSSEPLRIGEPDAEARLVSRKVGQSTKTKQKRVKFDYLKSTLFRVVHADGFHGGLTPNGKIHLAVFNERRAIARSEIYLIKKDTLGPLESRLEREAIVREVEVSVLMDLDKAIALHSWLDRLFKQVEAIQGSARMKK